MIRSVGIAGASLSLAITAVVANAAPATAPTVPRPALPASRPAATTLPAVVAATRPTSVPSPVAARPILLPPPKRVVAAETLLYSIPPNVKVADTTASPDASHVLCVESRPKADADASSRARRYVVALNGKGGKDYEWIVGRSLAFSPDGSRYTFRVAQAGKVFAVIGDVGATSAPVEGKPYFMVGAMAFSADGKRWAHHARPEQGGQSLMVVDGKEGELFDAPTLTEEVIDDAEVTFSKDGRRLAYRARKAGKQAFVVDGVVGPWCDAVRDVMFSNDGGRVAYLAKVSEGGKDQYFAVIDGKPGKRYDGIVSLTLSADGRRVAYAAGRGDKQLLVANDVEYRPYDGIGDVAFSPDGRRLALIAKTAGKWTAIIDGKEGPAYEGVGRIYFSPDSLHVAYVAGQGGKQFAVVNGVPGPAYNGIGVVVFAPVGGRVAYGATNGKDRILVVDGKPLGNVGLFAFSPDGRRLAHAIPRFDATEGAERWTLGIDGVAATLAAPTTASTAAPSTAPDFEFEGFPLGARVVFDAPVSARIVAGRGKELFRVDVRAE